MSPGFLLPIEHSGVVRPREVKQVAWGHTEKWNSKDSDVALLPQAQGLALAHGPRPGLQFIQGSD